RPSVFRFHLFSLAWRFSCVRVGRRLRIGSHDQTMGTSTHRGVVVITSHERRYRFTQLACEGRPFLGRTKGNGGVDRQGGQTLLALARAEPELTDLPHHPCRKRDEIAR